ncbi:unnamed protein product [Camellia sinensis]
MPSVLTIEFLTRPFVPYLTSFHGASSFHRLKSLEKCDRRDPLATSVMDIGSTSISKDANSSHDLKQLHLEPSQCNGGVIESVSNDLGNDLGEFLHIQDDHKLSLNSILPQSSDENENSTVEKEDECEEPDQTGSTIVTSDKCLSKCTTFPLSSEKSPFAGSIDLEDGDREGAEVEDEEESAAVVKQNYYESVMPAQTKHILLPTPLKLVSAMKGSREKQGTPPMNLTVTWAPDVYDPSPAAPTCVRIKKPLSKTERKKKGKNKQKGSKPSKGGSSGKDKKQVRKNGGGSCNKCHQSLNDANDRAVDYNEASVELGDFDVGSPDSYCGTSFLEKYMTKLHFPLAEAT